MKGFCENTSECRHVLLLKYFGEDLSSGPCGNRCDNCLRKAGFTEDPDWPTKVKIVWRCKGILTLLFSYSINLSYLKTWVLKSFAFSVFKQFQVVNKVFFVWLWYSICQTGCLTSNFVLQDTGHIWKTSKQERRFPSRQLFRSGFAQVLMFSNNVE